ncbi:MAG: PAS-domain containing protein [Alphaproteobacteria bacterium]|nr:PAS-domain containing protein [Alphaproteobacteria bacterium]
MHILWLEDRTEDGNALRETSGKTLEAEEELARLRAALDTVPRPLWLRNAEQAIIWCNETYATFLGKSRDSIVEEQKEILSQQRKSKAAPHLPAPGPEMAADALQTGEIRETRGHSIIQGRRMLLNISEIPMPAYGMTLGIAYNVTREEDLENELKRHQSSNRELLEQLRSAIAIYGADERLEFYNSSYAQLWGLEDQWLNTRPRLGEIMEKLRETRRLPEQADFRRFKQSWRDMFTRLIDPFEDMLYLPDGTVLRMLAVPHSMGGLMMTFEDVTSRLELESSYNTLIAVQKETLDNLDEAIAVYGGDGRLKLWNPAFATLWKFNPESLSGEPHITTVVEKQKPFFEEKTWPRQKEDLIAKGLERRMQEGRLHRTNDTLVDYVTVPIPDGGVLISYRDVTDTVRVENALREKNAALEAAEQLKVDFLANVSYQLRTPLNAIMGFNEILGKEFFGPLNERQKQYTQDIQTASDRLLTLINDILDLATLEAGYMALDRSDVNIHSMLQGVRDLVEEWARKDQISLEIACPETIGAVYADERRLRQALINLVRNAITFTPAGGTIRIAATRSHAGFTITVSDTGVGISREDRMRIFEPFERAHSAVGNMRLSRSGAGLGLALVKNIIALHGGTVDLESEPGKGTAVSLFLPLTAVPTMLKLSVPVSGEESV